MTRACVILPASLTSPPRGSQGELGIVKPRFTLPCFTPPRWQSLGLGRPQPGCNPLPNPPTPTALPELCLLAFYAWGNPSISIGEVGTARGPLCSTPSSRTGARGPGSGEQPLSPWTPTRGSVNQRSSRSRRPVLGVLVAPRGVQVSLWCLVAEQVYPGPVA